MVIVLLLVWTLLALIQLVLVRQRRRPKTDKTLPIELGKMTDTDNTDEAETADGFSFFKKAEDAEVIETDEDPLLVAIEQEMLAVRTLYTGGQILRDVYVSETRRLYNKAQAVKNSNSE